MTARTARKSEGIARSPSRIGMPNHAADFQTFGIQSFNRLILRIEHFKVAIDIQTAECSKETAASLIHSVLDFFLQLREFDALFDHVVNLRRVANRPSLVTESIRCMRERHGAMAGPQTAVQRNPAASGEDKLRREKINILRMNLCNARQTTGLQVMNE